MCRYIPSCMTQTPVPWSDLPGCIGSRKVPSSIMPREIAAHFCSVHIVQALPRQAGWLHRLNIGQSQCGSLSVQADAWIVVAMQTLRRGSSAMTGEMRTLTCTSCFGETLCTRCNRPETGLGTQPSPGACPSAAERKCALRCTSGKEHSPCRTYAIGMKTCFEHLKAMP